MPHFALQQLPRPHFSIYQADHAENLHPHGFSILNSRRRGTALGANVFENHDFLTFGRIDSLHHPLHPVSFLLLADKEGVDRPTCVQALACDGASNRVRARRQPSDGIRSPSARAHLVQERAPDQRHRLGRTGGQPSVHVYVAGRARRQRELSEADRLAPLKDVFELSQFTRHFFLRLSIVEHFLTQTFCLDTSKRGTYDEGITEEGGGPV